MSGWWRAFTSELAPVSAGGRHRLSWTAVAAVVLAVMGLGRSVTFWVAPRKAFIGHGHWSMSFSPMPTVIHGYVNQADFVKHIHLSGTTTAGQPFDVLSDDGLYENISSSEFLRLAYAEAFLAPARERSLGILADGFCDRGPLSRNLGLNAPIREIVSETPRQTTVGPDPVRIQIKCES